MRSASLESGINPLLIVCCGVWASLAHPETQRCAESPVVVTAQNQTGIALACDAAARAEILFADCAVPALEEVTNIRIVDDMPPGCLGLYYCETRVIEILSPDALHDQRPRESIFAHVGTARFFQSIVVHEIAHAATQRMPCPLDTCIVGPEYVAYLMQMKSLGPADQDQLTALVDMDAAVSSEEFNAFVLLLAPDVFSKRIWAHHHQQDDPCGFVNALMKGEVFLDFEIMAPE